MRFEDTVKKIKKISKKVLTYDDKRGKLYIVVAQDKRSTKQAGTLERSLIIEQ